ncbi:MAG TPA: hypothetical protein VM911_09530 [Pyrinomonadaceae bacterium]|nr:hypothetical protein [Pyrinomonadaceae bacterium]
MNRIRRRDIASRFTSAWVSMTYTTEGAGPCVPPTCPDTSNHGRRRPGRE